MKEFFDKLFTFKSAIRHLIMLLISAAVLGYTVLLISLAGNVVVHDITKMSGAELWNELALWGALVGILAALGAAIYYNAKNWMLVHLAKSLLCLLGAIPIVNLFITPAFRTSWLGSIVDFASPDDSGYAIYIYDEHGFYLGKDDGSLPLIVAIPFGIIRALFIGLGSFLWNLIIAIGIPLFSPIIAVVLLACVDALGGVALWAAILIGVLFVLGTLFAYVVQPVISLLLHFGGAPLSGLKKPGGDAHRAPRKEN